MDKDVKFNNYSLSDDEVSRIIDLFKKEIRGNSIIYGKYDEDCEQEISIAIYKSLTRNRIDKKEKNKKFFI